MSSASAQSGPASRRTLILCLILGLSVAVHRCVVGFDPDWASAGDQLASAPERGAAPAPAPATPAPLPQTAPTSDQAAPVKPAGADEPAAKREPRMNPYARRLWTMDPFRSPNVLRLAGDQFTVPEGARPLLDESHTREVLARTTVEHEVLANGGKRVSITMPGAPAPVASEPGAGDAVRLAAVPPASPSRRQAGPVDRSAAQATPAVASLKHHLSPSIFAFAGHDLTREESRRWTLALAFENRGY